MKSLRLCLVALALSSPASASAWCRMTTSNAAPATPTDCVTAGIPLAWRERCLSFSVDRGGSPDLDLASVRATLATSFDQWNQVTCNGTATGIDVTETTELATCTTAEYRRSGGNVNTVAFVDDFVARMYPANAYAITTVWHDTDTGEILDADMLLNEQQGPYANCPASGCPLVGGLRTVDLADVTTHEAGHFLGLAHSADPTSTMYYEAPRGETTKRTLEADDIAGLCAAYPPGSLPSACDPTPKGGFAPNCEQSPSGRCSAAPVPTGTSFAPVWLVALAGLASWARRATRRGSRAS